MGNNVINSFGFISGCGSLLRGAKFVNGLASNLNSTVDIYTCPTGRKAYISAIYSSGGTSVTGTYKIKVGGNYYNRSTPGLSVSSNSFNTMPTVINAGESFSITINAGGGTGANIWVRIIEMDISSPIYSPRLLTISSGNNTLYTVPSGKTALILDGYGGQGNAAGTPNGYFNVSGGAITVSSYVVPNAGSPGTGNLLNTGSVANNGSLVVAQSMSMNSGDSIVVNSASSSASQWAWVTVLEL
jgi:hypothetical protein